MNLEKPNPTDIESLYRLSGRALCAIQFLEDALSHSITLKKEVRVPNRLSRKEADILLTKYRSYTLGRAITVATTHKLYHESLLAALKQFLDERNWLVHKSIIHNADDLDVRSKREILLTKIQTTADNAYALQRAIEVDMLKFSKNAGVDMSVVEAIINFNFRPQ